MGTDEQVLQLLDELAVREDVPADARERASLLAEARRPAPETVKLLAEMDELIRRLG